MKADGRQRNCPFICRLPEVFLHAAARIFAFGKKTKTSRRAVSYREILPREVQR